MDSNFSIGFFEKDDNDQKDALYYSYLKKLVNHDVDIFPKPVAFVNRKDKAKHKKTPSDGDDDVPSIAKTCGCLNTFLFECNKRQVRPQVALVECKIGRILIKKGKRFVRSVSADVWEYHSCFVLVDKKYKIVLIHNPWRERTARTRNVVRLANLRPHLLFLFAKNFLIYDIYYKAGAQVGSSDCRVQVLRFAKTFGVTNFDALRTNPSAFGWKLLSR
jgi:hypothetical protein